MHLADNCEVEVGEYEVSCTNVPRFNSFRIVDSSTLECSCMTSEHVVRVSELPDGVVETLTRRLFERNKEHQKDQRELLVRECMDRGISIPETPEDVEWFVVDVTEEEVRELEKAGYPEAYQMSQVARGEDSLGMWEQNPDDLKRVMLVSDWGLRNIDESIRSRSIPLSESEYSRDYF